MDNESSVLGNTFVWQYASEWIIPGISLLTTYRRIGEKSSLSAFDGCEYGDEYENIWTDSGKENTTRRI